MGADAFAVFFALTFFAGTFFAAFFAGVFFAGAFFAGTRSAIFLPMARKFFPAAGAAY